MLSNEILEELIKITVFTVNFFYRLLLLIGHTSEQLSSCLMFLQYGCDDINELFFQLSSQHFARGVVLSNLLQFDVVFKEECEILIGDVNITVSALGPVLLNGVSATREGVLVDLILHLLRDKCGRFGH